MLKNVIAQSLIPPIEKAILNERHKGLVRLSLTIFPFLEKELMDRLSKDRVKR